MNNTVRIALAVAYAAVGIWALMPTPPKPLAAATSPPPAWERPRYERPVPAPRPRRSPPEDMVQPDEFRGSADDTAKPEPMAQEGRESMAAPVQHLPMEPADLWALANLRFAELPPIEFDHVPDKKLVMIKDVATEEELRTICRWPKTSAATLVGCADTKDPDVCHIYISGSIPSWAGLTRNIVIRHEMGHCNGWPGTHEGMR